MGASTKKTASEKIRGCFVIREPDRLVQLAFARRAGAGRRRRHVVLTAGVTATRSGFLLDDFAGRITTQSFREFHGDALTAGSGFRQFNLVRRDGAVERNRRVQIVQRRSGVIRRTQRVGRERSVDRGTRPETNVDV